MRRWDIITAHLREFETYFSDRLPRPLQVALADDGNWSELERQALRPKGYPGHLTGIYFYVDVCTSNDIHGRPEGNECRYSVIRKLGKATTSFYDRVRKAHWRQPGGTELLFSHRWIDIVAVPKELGFVTVALENFLLSRIRTQMDSQDVPKALLTTLPTIFDDIQSE